MPSRREFLQTSAAAAVALNGINAAAAGPPAIKLSRAVYDGRYAEGRRFAEVVAAQGVPTRALDDGDITRFWYDELDALWKREPAAIAGFTQFGPMFVVERLALERRMQLVLRVEHCAADGGLQHSLNGPRATLELVKRTEALTSDWPAVMAVLACNVGADDSARAAAELALSQPSPTLESNGASAPSIIHYYMPLGVQQGYGLALDGPLYSWVVAPRARGG
jgi:hypothetical protein